MNNFIYFDEGFESTQMDLSKKLLTIPRNIKKKEDLLEIYSKGLEFPYYFGHNWDALYDFLTDLTWINVDLVQIVHKDMPLAEKKEKKIYLDLLFDVLNDTSNSSHKFMIYFPENCKVIINSLIKE